MTQNERNTLTINYLNSIGYNNKVAVFTTDSGENKIVFSNGVKVATKLQDFLKELGYNLYHKSK